MENNLIKSSLFLSLALLLGRISGVLREWIISFKLGFSKETDVAVLLLSFPDFITSLLLAGGFSTALIPLLKKYTPDIAKAIFLKMLFYVGIFASLVSLFLFLFPKVWLLLLAPGIDFQIMKLKLPLLLTFISIPFAMMSCVFTAYLNSNNKFFVSGLGTLIFNTCIIIALLICSNETYLLIFLSLGILSGSLLRFKTQQINQPEVVSKVNWETSFFDFSFIKNFLLASFCSSIAIMVPFLARTSCSFFGEGQIAIFNYANKFIEIPLSVFITTIGVVLYPLLCSSDSKKKKYYETVALQKTLLFSFVFLIFGLFFGDNILQVIYQYGKCSEKNIMSLYEALKCLLFLLPFAAIDTIYSAQLNANNHIKKVWYSSLGALIILIFLEILAIKIKISSLIYWSIVIFYLCRSLLLIKFGNHIVVFTKSFIKNIFFILLIFVFCVYVCSWCMSSFYLKLIIEVFCGGFLVMYTYKIKF